MMYIPRNLYARFLVGVGLDEAAIKTLGAITLQGIGQFNEAVRKYSHRAACFGYS
jgi:hypothetical protein